MLLTRRALRSVMRHSWISFAREPFVGLCSISMGSRILTTSGRCSALRRILVQLQFSGLPMIFPMFLRRQPVSRRGGAEHVAVVGLRYPERRCQL